MMSVKWSQKKRQIKSGEICFKVAVLDWSYEHH